MPVRRGRAEREEQEGSEDDPPHGCLVGSWWADLSELMARCATSPNGADAAVRGEARLAPLLRPGLRKRRTGADLLAMAIFDRSSDARIDVRLPRSQEPMTFAETAVAVFVGLWAFTISLWLVSILFLGTVLRGALNGLGG